MKTGVGLGPFPNSLLGSFFLHFRPRAGRLKNTCRFRFGHRRLSRPGRVRPVRGSQFVGQGKRGMGEKLVRGGTVRGRVTFYFSKYIGLELRYNFTAENVRLLTSIAPGLPTYNFENQIHCSALNTVSKLIPRACGTSNRTSEKRGTAVRRSVMRTRIAGWKCTLCQGRAR